MSEKTKEKVQASDSSTAEYRGRMIVDMTIAELSEAHDDVAGLVYQLGGAHSELEQAIDEAQSQISEAEKLGIMCSDLQADAWAVEEAEAAVEELADEIHSRIVELGEDEE